MCSVVGVLFFVYFLWLGDASAQQSDIRVTKVRDHFFMLTGAGGNVAALVFAEGITLVDSGRVDMSDKLLAALRTLSAQPVRYIINTSPDPDHTGGNEGLGRRAGRSPGGTWRGRSPTPGKARKSSRTRTSSSA